MKNKKLKGLIVVVCLFLLASLVHFVESSISSQHTTTATMWKYQCIDTMKVSRDDARSLVKQQNIQNFINQQVKEIKDLGANCIAIDTPYDKEFLPYLTMWVNAARTQQLHVWFRGSFSGWEGWFGYPKITDYVSVLKNTHEFILQNPTLFQDSDIFTALPEAENGGLFLPKTPDLIPAYRNFLAMEVASSDNAFKQIGKSVVTNWTSMSGGYAKTVLDQDTVKKTGNIVTIDHYVSNPQEMADFIDYFHNTFTSQVVIGEFGAPIPDINGQMNVTQQKEFVDQLLYEMYKRKNEIAGVNYWVLTDGTTALYDGITARPVTDIIKKYFMPGIIQGHVTDAFGTPLKGVFVTTDDSIDNTETDKNGNYALTIPEGNVTIRIGKSSYRPIARSYRVYSGQEINGNVALEHTFPTWFEKVNYAFQQSLNWI